MMTSSLISSTEEGLTAEGTHSPRAALVGDAAHTMHPMARTRVESWHGRYCIVVKSHQGVDRSGMDVGGTRLFLDRYNRERMVNGLGVVGGVHE